MNFQIITAKDWLKRPTKIKKTYATTKHLGLAVFQILIVDKIKYLASSNLILKHLLLKLPGRQNTFCHNEVPNLISK